ncbi:unnamed protein product [Rhizoctonia solani]|uniref:SP-RING-type domain-containing protein n=1 Tax=Rhizoctonia solani TaxID=456999 RepID=A0A8H3HKY7_9AGAM|nr:unnamed protein product [Rhizoctonia solani]
MDERSIAREVRALRRLPFTEVRQSIIQSMQGNHDVESQRHALNLRCPLSQFRIRDPARFSGCTHYQCFDATAFLMVTHRARTRGTANLRCPICERNVNQRDMVIDLYFDDILRRAPVTTNEVFLQVNGEWRTRDGQFASLREAVRVTINYTNVPANPPPHPTRNGQLPRPNPAELECLAFFSIIGFVWFIFMIHRLLNCLNLV